MVHFILILLGLSTLLAIAIGWVTWRQRPQPGTTAFSIGMGGLAWLLGCMLIGNTAWTLFEAADVSYIFLRLKWLGTNVMVVGWFFFALSYTGRVEYITRRVVGIASIVPAISTILLFSNDRFLEILASTVGLTFALPDFDLWISWQPFDIAYIYALVIAGGILIIGMIIKHQLPHPELAGLWILAISVPFAVNVTYLARILPPLGTPVISVDPTPLAFLLTGTMGLAAILRYDSFEKAPVARTYVVDELRAGVLVYDDECRIVDHNTWLTSVLELPDDAIGEDVRHVLGERLDLNIGNDHTSLDAADFADRLEDRQIDLDERDQSIYLDVEVTPLESPEGLSIGYSVLWYDVTAQKRYERELETSNERLAYERDLKERIRDTLINTSTQRELERAFCQSALGGNRVVAWVGQESAAGEVSIRTIETDDAYEGMTDENAALKPLAERALSKGATAVEKDLNTTDEPWARELLDVGLSSGIAIPLTHNELAYGVFCLFGTTPDAFENREQALLEDTAESLAFSLHGARQRESLRSEEPMRVVFDVQDAASYLWSLANGSVPPDGTIDVSEVKRGDDDDHAVHLLTTTNVEPDTIREAIASHEAVQLIETIGNASGSTPLQVGVAMPTVQSEIARLGGAVRSTTVSEGRVQVISEFSRRADLEGVLGGLRDHFPDIDIVSRVYVDRSEETQLSRSTELTEKQLNALRTAYVSGFFHRPQQATANEVADVLGVSRTTFLQHLRTAERQLFGSMFDE